MLDRIQPDVVHVGHLNDPSTSPREAAAREIPIVYTLHDYWLMCPRGQFMQMFPQGDELWDACSGQEDRKCAERCYARYFSGAPEERDADVAYWSGWVGRRMQHVREMAELVDVFVAPARYLHDRHRDAFGLPQRKLVYLDYGFARERMSGRVRTSGEPFTFGYIGTHIPAKGIDDLIRAFGQLRGDARLRIWGGPAVRRRRRSWTSPRVSPAVRDRIERLPEYRNRDIVRDVFDRVDAIVVPSVWVENSPLVIHEAQQARVPVITADAGGMREYVAHEVTGLLFDIVRPRHSRRRCSGSRMTPRSRSDSVHAATSSTTAATCLRCRTTCARSRRSISRCASVATAHGCLGTTARGGSRSIRTPTPAT